MCEVQWTTGYMPAPGMLLQNTGLFQYSFSNVPTSTTMEVQYGLQK